MDIWKDRVVKFLKLKNNGVVFNPHLYDFVYVSLKRSMGVITETNENGTFGISFFKSLKNTSSFYEDVELNKDQDLVIPRYESLLDSAHMLIKKVSDKYTTGGTSSDFEIDHEDGSVKNHNKHKLYGRLNILFKQTGDSDDYDNLLNMVVKLIQENQSRHTGRG